MKHFFFAQIDSWFFRESRSMDGSGATALESMFPPPNSTLLGALRSHIGNQYHARHQTTWKDFSQDHPLAQLIGFADDYANLKAQGAWLYNTQENQLYFPCPDNILQHDAGYDFFQLGSPTASDLGTVRLATLDFESGQKPLEDEGMWISARDMSRVLAGKPPKKVISLNDISNKDPRLGISRNNQIRRTEEGKLYQTNHIRLNEQWLLYMGLDGLDDAKTSSLDITTKQIIRLGGEARMAHLFTAPTETAEHLNLPAAPQPTARTEPLIMYLLTPLPWIKNEPAALPARGFQPVTDASQATVWQGNIAGIDVEIISAITGKTERIGGWNMAKRQSFPVRSFLPAGSCWYFHLAENAPDNALQLLHGAFLSNGKDRALGYGQILIGQADFDSKKTV